jgi:hypothetical protein
MFIPFGFNQGFKGGSSGFDPTLGGVLNPAHWWDMTDSSNITESGGTVTGIGDKGTLNPEDVSISNGWTFYNTGPTFTGNSIFFNDNVIYKYSSTWPGDMTSQYAPSTWVMIGSVDNSAVGSFSFTGNRVGYPMLHQGILTKGTSPLRGGQGWNNNNGATANNLPNIFESYNKDARTSYDSFYSDVDIFSENMYASYQYKNGSSHYIETSLNGLPFGGQSPTKNISTSTTGNIAIAGSGVEVTFSRFSNYAFHGEISHIVVYYNQKLSNASLSALYATL